MEHNFQGYDDYSKIPILTITHYFLDNLSLKRDWETLHDKNLHTNV